MEEEKIYTSIGCNVCNKPVSMGIMVPKSFQIAAWIECVECVLKKGPLVEKVVGMLAQRLMKPEFYGGSDRLRAGLIDAVARDIVSSLDNTRFRQGA